MSGETRADGPLQIPMGELAAASEVRRQNRSAAGKGRETQRLHRAASVRETDSQYARSPKIWRI